MTGFLFEAALKSSMLVLVGLLAVSMFRVRSAALRHWILAAAIVSGWATLPLSMAMPAWLRTAVGPPRAAAPPAPRLRSSEPVEGSVSQTVEIAPILRAPSNRQPSFDVVSTLSSVWLLGALCGGAVLIVGFTRLRSVASHARDVIDGPWASTLDELRAAYGLTSRVRVLQSDHPSLLVTWGWRRPAIVLPAPARAWSTERIRVVLAHECAHVARGDWPVQILAETLRAFCWFNPLMWLACRRLRDASERACDDVVLGLGIPAASYASHLVDLVRRLHPVPRPPLPALTMARSSGLEGRIVAMLNSSANRRPTSRRTRLLTAAALLALALPVAALHAQQSFFSLQGTVRDPSDRVLPEATLVLTNDATSAKYEVRSNGVGQFQFVGLPAASYKLTASRAGFALFSEAVSVTGNVARDIRLKVGSLQETITVTDRSVAPSAADPAVQQRREAVRRKFEELTARTKAQCAAGVDSLVGGSLVPPAKLVDVRPIYPEHLKSAKVGGVVTMDAVIGTDGLVKEIDNVHGPDPALEQAAAEAVRQWQFSSTLLNCQAIDVNMQVTTSFRVEP